MTCNYFNIKFINIKAKNTFVSKQFFTCKNLYMFTKTYKYIKYILYN